MKKTKNLNNPLLDAIIEMRVVPLTTIKPYWRNPRDNEAAIEPVAESIRRYGYCQPIVVDRDGVIVAGHTRYKALLRLNIHEAQVITVNLTAAQAKQYRIVDNKTAEFAKWVNDDLLAELREFENLKSFEVFFPGGELDSVLAETDEVQVPPPASAVDTELEVERKDEVEVFCPECGSVFNISRSELLKVNPAETSEK